MNHIETLKQALEALEMARRFVYSDNRPQCDEAITTLRIAIEQAEKQEPVAWRWVNGKGWLTYGEMPHDRFESTPLYTTPPAAPVQDVSLIDEGKTAAQRQWVGLTDEEKGDVCRVGAVYAPDGVVARTPLEYRKELEGVRLMAVRQAEAKLRDKNGGQA